MRASCFFSFEASLCSESSSWSVSVTQPMGLWNDPPQGSPGAQQPPLVVPFTLLLPYQYFISFFSPPLCITLLYIHLMSSPSYIGRFHLFSWRLNVSCMNPVCMASIRSTTCIERWELDPVIFIGPWKCSTNRNSLSQQLVLLSVIFGGVWSIMLKMRARQVFPFVFFLFNPFQWNVFLHPWNVQSLSVPTCMSEFIFILFFGLVFETYPRCCGSACQSFVLFLWWQGNGWWKVIDPSRWQMAAPNLESH